MSVNRKETGLVKKKLLYKWSNLLSFYLFCLSTHPLHQHLQKVLIIPEGHIRNLNTVLFQQKFHNSPPAPPKRKKLKSSDMVIRMQQKYFLSTLFLLLQIIILLVNNYYNANLHFYFYSITTKQMVIHCIHRNYYTVHSKVSNPNIR